MRKIVITGVSSFVGFHLARHFARDHHVIGSHSRPRAAYEGIEGERLARLANRVTLAPLELTAAKSLRGFVAAHRPDCWIQHAGWARQYGGFDYDFEQGVRVNTIPLYTLYPALHEVGCRGVVLTGSSAEYSDSDRPNREDETPEPALPYGLAKLSATLAAMQLSKRHDVATRVVRLFIPFGPLDNPHKLVPYTIDRLRKGEPVSLSPCTQQRDFIYIEDVLEIYSACLNDLTRGGAEIFNGCSGVARPLREMLDVLCEALGKPADLLRFGDRTMREGETAFSVGSFEKLRDRLGMRELRSLRKAAADYLELERDLEAEASAP
jgi:nucleoside-diphosphate-sugar epimerase